MHAAASPGAATDFAAGDAALGILPVEAAAIRLLDYYPSLVTAKERLCFFYQ